MYAWKRGITTKQRGLGGGVGDGGCVLCGAVCIWRYDDYVLLLSILIFSLRFCPFLFWWEFMTWLFPKCAYYAEGIIYYNALFIMHGSYHLGSPPAFAAKSLNHYFVILFFDNITAWIYNLCDVVMYYIEMFLLRVVAIYWITCMYIMILVGKWNYC